MRFYLLKATNGVLYLLLAFLAWKFVPGYAAAFFLSRDLDLYALNAANARLSEGRIRNFIAGEIAKKHLQPQDVRVEVNLEERTVSIDVRYQADVDLILRRMTLAFHASARRHAMPTSEDMKEYGVPKQ